MTDRISTEEAERTAAYLENYDPSPNNFSGRLQAVRVIRSLAAERDALERKVGRLTSRGFEDLWHENDEMRAQVVQMREALKEIDAYVRDALWEYQP